MVKERGISMSNNLKKSQTAQFTEDVTVQVQDWRDDLTDILEQRESFFYEAENCVDLIERINEISKFYPFGSYVRRYLYRNYLPKTIDQPFRKIKESVFLEELKQLLQEYKKTNPSFPVTNQILKTWISLKENNNITRRSVLRMAFLLQMSLEDASYFLKNVLGEQQIQCKDAWEAICGYCFKTKKKYYEAEALYDEFKKRYAANLNEYLSQLDRVKYTADVNSALLNAETDQEFLDRLMLEPFYQLDLIKEILLGSDEQLRDQILSVFSVSYEKEVKELKKIIASEKEAEKLVDKNQRRRQTNAAKSKLERKLGAMYPVLTEYSVTAFKLFQENYDKIQTRLNSPKEAQAAVANELELLLTEKIKTLFCKKISDKKLTPDRISKLLNKQMKVDRKDLIKTELFLKAEQMNEEKYWKPREEYYDCFQQEIDYKLRLCGMAELNMANPYDCFVMLCFCSDDPYELYQDVMEASCSL